MGKSVGGVGNLSWYSIEIEGQNLKASSNFLRAIHLLENPYTVPSAQIDFLYSDAQVTETLSLVDGTRIKLAIGQTEEQAEEISVIVLSTKELSDTDGQRILRAVCTIDAPQLLYDTKQFKVKGTSKAAMAEVCEFAGLTLDSDIEPNDNMLWLSMAQSPRKFLSEIEQHSWIDDQALVKAVFTLDKRLVVRNVNKVINDPPKHKATTSLSGEDGSILFYEFNHKSISGTNNGLSNYGEKVFWSSGSGDVEMLEEVRMTTENKVNVNSTVRDSIEGARIRYEHPSNDVNIHKNYRKSKYNWMRQNMAYTELARGLVRGHAGMDILESVDMYSGQVSSNAADKPMMKSSGKWIVIGRTRSIISGNYAEAYLMARNFSNVDGVSAIGGGKNVEQSKIGALLRPLQINPNISLSSKIDEMVAKQNAMFEGLLDKFKAESSKFGFTELYDKYGSGFDALMGILQEFNLATFLLKMCEALNFLEKLSLNLVIEWKIPFLDMLGSRMDRLEDMLAGFTGDINNLIAQGDIPASYIGGPQINQRCVSNKIEDLVGAVTDKLPSKCLDARSMGSIHGPSFNVSSLLRQLEENLRNLLCALGDGTVDGSALKGVVPTEELAFYAPGLNEA